MENITQIDKLVNQILEFAKNQQEDIEYVLQNNSYLIKEFIGIQKNQILDKKINYLANICNNLLYFDFPDYKKQIATLIAFYQNSKIKDEENYLQNKQYIFNVFSEILQLDNTNLKLADKLLQKMHLEDIRMKIVNEEQYQIYFRILENINFESILQDITNEYYIIKEYKINNFLNSKNNIKVEEKANYYLTNEKGEIYSNQRLKGQNFYNLLNDCVELGKCNDFREILYLKNLYQYSQEKLEGGNKKNENIDLFEINRAKMKDLIKQQVKNLQIMANTLDIDDKKQIKNYLTKFYRHLSENGLAFKYLDLELLDFIDNGYIEFAQKAVENNGLALKYVDIEKLADLEDYYSLCQIAINQNYKSFEYIKWSEIKKIYNDKNLSLWYESFASQIIQQYPMSLKYISFNYLLDLENPQQKYFDLCQKACLGNKKAVNLVRWEALKDFGPSYILKDIFLGKLNQNQLNLF